ncbi:hypothetical protein HDC90_005041 [Pedobacter sp. AK013]|nr:hypothetical protein [Pedobacter sp. AK013]
MAQNCLAKPYKSGHEVKRLAGVHNNLNTGFAFQKIFNTVYIFSVNT